MKEMSFMTRDKSGQYIIRNIRKSEIGLLKDFLYEAVFVPGEWSLLREIL